MLPVISVTLDKPSAALSYASAFSSDDQTPAYDEVATSDAVTIHATVVLKVAKPTTLTSLLCTFASVQVIEDRQERRFGVFDMHRFEVNLLLRKTSTIGVGIHTFQATFDVPSWLPATLEADNCRIKHSVTAAVSVARPAFYLGLKKTQAVTTAPFILQRGAPRNCNSLRYWSGERQTAETALAIRTSRHVRIDGKVRLSLRVRSSARIEQCTIDLIQQESISSTPEEDSFWMQQGGVSRNPPMSFFLDQSALQEQTIRVNRYPMPTIEARFPMPEAAVEDEATLLSQVNMTYKLTGDNLQPDIDTPMLSIRHKLRIRLTPYGAKEVIVQVPLSIYAGSAACDDVPPFYDEIDLRPARSHSRADSVATLPLYRKESAQMDVETDTSFDEQDLRLRA